MVEFNRFDLAREGDSLPSSSEKARKEIQDLTLYNARLYEHIGKFKLISGRVDKIDQKIEEIDDDNMIELFDEAEEVYTAESGIITDSHWISALREADIPIDAILRVWDLKDEQVRQYKEIASNHSD